MAVIYVIARDGGCEGHSPPIQAFYNLDEVRAAVALTGGCIEVFEVPIWPQPAKEWFYIEPIKEKK